MARPTKQGLDYFNLDVDFLDDPKFINLIATFGSSGVHVLMQLMSWIYREGYALQWSERVVSRLSAKTKIEKEAIEAIVQTLVDDDFFDLKDFQNGWLSSDGFRKRYAQVGRKRADFNSNEGFRELLPVSSEFPPVSDNIRTQSKVKESKEKKIKVNKSKEEENKLIRYVRIKDIPLSDYESEFQLKFPAVDIQAEYEEACDWELSKGRIHKDALAFFRNWCRKTQKESSRYSHPFVGGNGNSPPLGKSKQTIAFEKNMALVREMEQRAANAK